MATMTRIPKTDAAVGVCKGSSRKFKGRLDGAIQIRNRAADSAAKNGEFNLPADGWHQLVPLGEFAGDELLPGKDPAPVVQVIDAAALQAMLTAWQKDQELLIDYEHFSHDADKATVAAGWLTALELREDGIYGRIRWSDKGRADVQGGNYRFISPEFGELENLGGNRRRPRSIDGAGLTNRPALKTLKPLCNRAATTTQNKNTMDYKTLLIQLLGLAPEATDEAITQAVAAKATTQNADTPEGDAPETVAELKEEVAELEKEVEELKEELIEADLEEHKAVIANRDVVKTMLIQNRKATLEMLNKGLKKPTEVPARVYNRTSARTPASSTPASQAAAAEKHAAAVRNRANAILAAEPHLSTGQAYNRARAEITED